MTVRTALRWFFAVFCCVMCYYASLSWLEGQGFSSAQHYHAESAPDFSQYDAWQEELQENPNTQLMATAAWSHGGVENLSTEVRSAMVDIYYAKGNTSLILPVRMISGHLPIDDEYSIALDDNSAYALTGATNIVGTRVVVGEKEYTVCGVFRAPRGMFSWGNDTGRGMAFLTPGPERKIATVGLLLDRSPEEMVKRTQDTAGFMGSAGYTEDRNMLALFIRQFGLLPLWIWAFAAMVPLLQGMFRYVRRGPMFDPLVSTAPQRFLDLFLRIALTALSAAICFGLVRLADFSPEIPAAWLPTRWSDFSHWPGLVAKLGQTWATARQLPVLRPELMRWTLCGITVIFCALAVVLKPRRVERLYPGYLLLAAALPALAIALAAYLDADIVFAPALVLVPAACVFAQWIGHSLYHARDYRGVEIRG